MYHMVNKICKWSRTSFKYMKIEGGGDVLYAHVCSRSVAWIFLIKQNINILKRAYGPLRFAYKWHNPDTVLFKTTLCD